MDSQIISAVITMSGKKTESNFMPNYCNRDSEVHAIKHIHQIMTSGAQLTTLWSDVPTGAKIEGFL